MNITERYVPRPPLGNVVRLDKRKVMKLTEWLDKPIAGKWFLASQLCWALILTWLVVEVLGFVARLREQGVVL